MRQFFRFPTDDVIQGELAAHCKMVESEIQRLEVDQNALDCELEAKRREDVEVFSPESAKPLFARRVELLTREVALRRQWHDLSQDISRAFADAVEPASLETEKIEAKLESALVKMGWDPCDSQEVSRIYPGLIKSHPKVREARGRVEELKRWSDRREQEAVNGAALDAVISEIRRVKETALTNTN